MVSKEVKRERVAAAVSRLVHERGIEAATVGRIVAEAGIARSAFYGLFENRDDALRFAVQAGERRLLRAIDESLGREGGWEEGVAATLGALLLAAQGDPLLAEIALVFRVADGGLPSVGPCNPRLVEALAGALGAGRRRAPAAPGPRTEELVALGVLGVVIGRLRRDEADGLSALGPELTQLATRAFAVPSGLDATRARQSS